MRVGLPVYRSQVPAGAALVMCAAILSCACTRNTSEITIVPPPTHPLSRSVIGYGVVSNPYTRVVLDPDRSEVSLGYLRRGSVVRVIERRSVNNRGTAESWVLVEGNYQGWLPEMVIDIYDLEAKAATAAEFMTQ